MDFIALDLETADRRNTAPCSIGLVLVQQRLGRRHLAALEEGLTHAKAECDARVKLNRVQLVDDYLSSNRRRLLENAFLSLVQSQPGTADAKAAELLQSAGVLDRYAVVYLPLDFSATDWETALPEERAKLFGWVQELCVKNAGY